MKNIKILLLVFFTIANYSNGMFAQDFSDMKGKAPVKINGGLSLQSQYRSNANRIPGGNSLAWAIGGNINFNIYGLSIPLSVSIQDNNRAISNPFNRFGLSPSYKWIKVHAGHRSMQFSPYTYDGHTFLGAGIELLPGKFRFSAFTGTMQSFYPITDTLAMGNSLPTFKRKALGAKIGFGSNKAFLDLMVFKAKDALDEPIIPDSLFNNIRPQNNVALGLNGKLTLFKRLHIKANIGASSLTGDVRARSTGIDQETLSLIEPYQEINRTTRFSFAGDASAQVSFQGFRFGIAYKMVEPFYQSLGVYNMLNDFQNMTFNAGFNTAKNTLRIDGKFGLQKNNLKDFRRFTNARTILSLNVTVRPSKAFSVRANYSNFENERTAGIVEVEDTLRYANTTHQLQFFPQLRFGSETIKQAITASYNIQGLREQLPNLQDGRNTSTNYANLNYSIQWKDLGLRLKAGGHYNLVDYVIRQSSRLGFQVGVRKQLLDNKISLTNDLRYSNAKLNGTSNGNVLNYRFGFTYRPVKKHRFSLSARMLSKTPINQDKINDFRGRVGYQMTF